MEEEKVRGFEFAKRIRKVVAFSDNEVSKEKWILIIPLNDAEMKLSDEIKSRAMVSCADADIIAIAESRSRILLTDDTFAGKIALQRKVNIFDLKTFFDACVMDGLIKSSGDMRKIMSDLKSKDFYEFSEEDRNDLLSFFE